MTRATLDIATIDSYPQISRRWYLRFLRFIHSQPLATIGIIILAIVMITALLAQYIAPYPFQESHIADRLQGPSLKYWLGTDQLGRDIFSRLVFGAKLIVMIGFTAVGVGSGLAMFIGVISGYFGGRTDVLIQRFVDIWMAFPGLILVITLVSILGNSATIIAICIGLLIASHASRIIRADVLRIKQMAFVEGATALGAGNLHIIARHIIPNILPIVIVLATMQIGSAILTSAAISFLGYGVPPPQPSWGAMLSTDGRAAFLQQPLLAVWPGLAITAVVWAANMLGDGIRDVLDPRLRQ